MPRIAKDVLEAAAKAAWEHNEFLLNDPDSLKWNDLPEEGKEEQREEVEPIVKAVIKEIRSQTAKSTPVEKPTPVSTEPESIAVE